MKIGFIGLGNVGGKLAGSLSRNQLPLMVHDIDPEAAAPLLRNGARWGETPAEVAAFADMVITCLPAPSISAAVMEAANGVLSALSPGAIWAEMSTTDAAEVKRLAVRVDEVGGLSLDCPVSGGCHRAATGNISIFAGGERATFEKALPVLTRLGRRVLHTGGLGTASVLKVVTNYLATAHLVSLCEALVTAQQAGMDMATTYEAIRISSGNSFVHETESQVILNGSRDINFTMDLVLKDVSLFQAIADTAEVPLELSPLLLKIFQDGIEKYGGREWSPNIIRRLEDKCRTRVTADGFPAEIVDTESEKAGYEIVPGHAAAADGG